MDEESDKNAAPLQERYFEERCYLSEWWNTGEDEPVSVARVRVEPGITTRLHRLNGIAERYFILAGRGRAEIDGRAREVGPGAVVLIPASAAQRITNTGECDLTFLAVCTPRFRADLYEDLEPRP